MFPLKPIGPRVIVQPTEPPKETRSGILLPETKNTTPTYGMVIAVPEQGPYPHIGTTVYFPKYAGTLITIDEQQYVIIKTDELLAYQTQEEK